MKLTAITSPTPTYPVIIAGSTDDTDKEQGDPNPVPISAPLPKAPPSKPPTKPTSAPPNLPVHIQDR